MPATPTHSDAQLDLIFAAIKESRALPPSVAWAGELDDVPYLHVMVGTGPSAELCYKPKAPSGARTWELVPPVFLRNP